MNERLQSALNQLHLSGLGQSLDVRLAEAAGQQLNHAEFLELILQDELMVRQQRQIDRRVKSAGFRELKPLDDFNWAFNPSIKRAQIYDLATCRFSATAILDRFLHHAEVIAISGRSYRLRNQPAPTGDIADDSKPANLPTGPNSRKKSKPVTENVVQETAAACES